MSILKNPRLAIIIAMASFGTLSIFVRNISVSSGELALYRAVLAILLLSGYFLLTRQSIQLSAIKKELPLLLLSGVAMGFNWILLFQAYKYTTVSVATLSYYFAPVIVTAVCPFLFKEKLTPKKVLALALILGGIVLYAVSG